MLGLKYQLHQLRRSCNRSSAHLVQHRLNMMGEGCDSLQTNHGPGTFNGMERPEEVIDRLVNPTSGTQ